MSFVFDLQEMWVSRRWPTCSIFEVQGKNTDGRPYTIYLKIKVSKDKVRLGLACV